MTDHLGSATELPAPYDPEPASPYYEPDIDPR
jgi:hypothetical protein